MSVNYKILGQSSPSATTNTNVYTVPSGTEAIISSIVIANRSASNRTYRIAARPNGETIANTHYLAYDIPIAANDSTALSLGITLDQSDVITVYSSTSDLTFTIFGSEITD
jgi:hypothetical protein